MMNNKVLIGLVVLAAGVLVGWYFLKGNAIVPGMPLTNTSTPTPAGSNLGAPPPAVEVTNGLEKGGVAARTVVTLTDSGFSPTPVTVKVGTTVTFVNESSGLMWVASDPHPTHTLLPGFDELSSVGRGGTYDYTFVKIGTWTYHDHPNASIKGTVVVTQ